MSAPDRSEPTESADAESADAATEPSAAPAEFPPTTEMEIPAAHAIPTAVEPPVAVAQPEPDTESLVIEALGRIEGKLSESQRLIDRQAEIAAKLHAENQTLRGGELRTAQAALVLSVLRVYDDVNQMALTTEDPSASKDLGIVADALEEAMARNGIDPSTVSLGEPFEARAHKIAAIEATADPDADRTVARVVRSGFVWSDGSVVRVSDVAVFKYTPPPETVDSDVRDPAATEAEPSATPPDADSPDASPAQ